MTLIEFFEVARKFSETEVKHKDELAQLEANHQDQLARQAKSYQAVIEDLEGRLRLIAGGKLPWNARITIEFP